VVASLPGPGVAVEEAEERITAKQHGLAGGIRYGPALSLQLGVQVQERARWRRAQPRRLGLAVR
jgi:hypothetical protein